ncbi:MAG: hypothetical protein AABY18_09480 [Candidatus Thermoplasmatota archaeon]
MMDDRRTEPALRGLFDHAGMFPPAAKPLAGALHDAARFAAALRRPGLVGADLVIAWKDWPGLDGAALRAAGFSGTCRVAVVGVPCAQGPAIAQALAARAAIPEAVQVVSLEVHCEGDLDAAALRATVAAAHGIPVFVEPRWPADRVRTHVGHVALVAKACGAGLKVRCAGPTALDRPALAAAVRAAADAAIPFKATQGLHHPVPRPGFPHGFLGLLAALRLRQAEGPAFDDVEACLAESNPSAFDVRDGITWHGHRVAAARLAQLPAFAIGSCSLGEPDDDLMEAFGPAEPR